MIEKQQLESYRALAAKPGHDSVDASKALVALPALLAEVDRLRQLIAELGELAGNMAGAVGSNTKWQAVNELKARAGL